MDFFVFPARHLASLGHVWRQTADAGEDAPGTPSWLVRGPSLAEEEHRKLSSSSSCEFNLIFAAAVPRLDRGDGRRVISRTSRDYLPHCVFDIFHCVVQCFSRYAPPPWNRWPCGVNTIFQCYSWARWPLLLVAYTG